MGYSRSRDFNGAISLGGRCIRVVRDVERNGLNAREAIKAILRRIQNLLLTMMSSTIPIQVSIVSSAGELNYGGRVFLLCFTIHSVPIGYVAQYLFSFVMYSLWLYYVMLLSSCHVIIRPL